MGFLVKFFNIVMELVQNIAQQLERREGGLCKDSNWPNEPLVPTILPQYWAQILQGSALFALNP